MTGETTWEKIKRLATGRSRSQAYLDGAKERAHNAGGHLSDVSAVQVCTPSPFSQQGRRIWFPYVPGSAVHVLAVSCG